MASARIPLFVLVALAAVARLLLIGDESYWFDEIWALRQVRADFGDVLSSLAAEDVHPPLYPILLWGWTRLVGEGEAAVRLLSAIPGTMAVGFMYGVARRLYNDQTAVLAAGFLALNGFAVYFSQEARAYSWMLMLALMAWWLLLRWVERPDSRGRMMAYVAGCAALAYIHVFALFTLIAQGLWVLWTQPRLRVRMIVAGALVLGLFSPWIPVMLGQVGRVQTGFWIDPLVWTDPGKWLWYWSGYSIPLAVILPLLAVVGARHLGEHGKLVLLWILIPLGVPVLLSILGEPIFHHKYPITILGAYAVLVARGVVALPRPRLIGGAVAALMVFSLVGQLYLRTDKEQYRELAAAADAAQRSQGAVIVTEPGMTPYVTWYSSAPIISVATPQELDAALKGQTHAALVMAHPTHSALEKLLEARASEATETRLKDARMVLYKLGSETTRRSVQ